MNLQALNTKRRIAIGLTAIMLLAVLASMTQSTQYITPGQFPTGSQTMEANAAVTIKTQSAADKLVRNGASRGIDVSVYQGSINWSKVSRDNVDFAFIRASIGQENDTNFVYNAQNAYSNGIKVGAYHYAKFTDRASMQKEANQFLKQLRKVNINYPVVLDVEANRGMSKSTLTTLSREFLDILKAEGYTPMFYSYTNFINAYIDTNKLGYDLWIANYIQQPTGVDHKVWQHTSYGSVNGINGRVDINIAYNGSLGTRGGSIFDRGGSSDGYGTGGSIFGGSGSSSGSSSGFGSSGSSGGSTGGLRNPDSPSGSGPSIFDR